ncbi:MAG: molybdopterin molybdotransferase MoeA [Deltaproteobacteria bacterium]|nr:molybdopterin molybdotransferase MoeA [Deltaproteobacteria bacterium]MBW2530688.1 molybdopterin molybdotransferase MoeA [Deltaproteobacteria bacterium]
MPQAPLLDPDRAIELVLEHTPVGEVITVPIDQALGRCLAEPLVAATSQPPFARALMDGFAVRAADAGRQLPVAGTSAAGKPFDRALPEGSAVEIMTGAPCPDGTDAGVKEEDTTRHGDRVELPAHVALGSNLQPAGALWERGSTILQAQTVLSPLSLATAIGGGCSLAAVHRAPSLAVLTTGDELSDTGGGLEAAQIYDSNGPMLAAMARQLGVTAVERLHADDDADELARVLERAARADIVVISGGVSMGRFDLVPHIVETLGARTVFHKVRQKPGKPLLFAERKGKLIFGLPGTPLGSHLGFHRYVAPCIRQWMGRSTMPSPRVGKLAGPLEAHGQRTLFRLVRAELDESGWQIDPLRWHGSTDVIGPALANGYCRLEPGAGSLPAGSEISWEPIEGAAP